MGRQTIDGYAVIQPKFASRGLEVVGVGQNTPEAWRDASERTTNGRVASRDMYREYPEMKCVPAKITVTFDNQN